VDIISHDYKTKIVKRLANSHLSPNDRYKLKTYKKTCVA